jgi:hypothetical protein
VMPILCLMNAARAGWQEGRKVCCPQVHWGLRWAGEIPVQDWTRWELDLHAQSIQVVILLFEFYGSSCGWSCMLSTHSDAVLVTPIEEAAVKCKICTHLCFCAGAVDMNHMGSLLRTYLARTRH